MIFVHILISILFYFLLMYLSVNLLGMLVRGFFPDPDLDKLKKETEHDFLKEEIIKFEQGDKYLNIIAFIGIIGYLYITYHFWNIGVTVVAILLMLVRLPDLLWEIKTGQQHNPLASVASIPKNVWYYITVILTFVALPILYYALYHF